MSGRWWMALAAVMLTASCAQRGPVELTGEERETALSESAHAPRQFAFERTEGERHLRVEGEVEDDYRYRASVSEGGRPAYDEVDIDDRRFLRLRELGSLPEAARADPSLGPFSTGAWVADLGKAPPEFLKADAPVRLLDPAVVLEKVRFLERMAEAELQGPQVRNAARHDPKSTRYLRRNDKFRAHPQDGVRYDIFPAPYPGDTFFIGGIPDDLDRQLEPHAMYTSFWFKDGRVTRVERFFDLDVETVQKDMKEALERRAARTGARGGELALPELPKPYREVHTFTYPPEPIRIEAPETHGAVIPPVIVRTGGGPGEAPPA